MAALQAIWSQADTGKKTGLVLGVGAILIFLIGAIVWLSRTDYQVLFSGLDPRDAAAAINELERMKVDYRLEEDGTSVVVPGDQVHQVRLKLMGGEMPIAGTVGLEIFNESDFGMTEFAQKINFQRALQGELTRTIMSLDEVKYARVHLVMPESGLFKSEGKEPSASVTLFLKKGRSPDARMISGIQRLVSSSVPELKSEMVTVSDQRGETLSRPPDDAMGMESISKRLKKQQEVEDYYVKKITQLLASRYQLEDIAVSVNVSLSYDQVRVTRNGVLGAEDGSNRGVLRRRETSFGAGDRKEKSNGSKTTEIDYELGHQIEQTVEAPGRILKISVGVLVPSGLIEEQRQEINELVSMVIGFDASRGDAIAVYSGSFLKPAVAETSTVISDDSQMASDVMPSPPEKQITVVGVSENVLTAKAIEMLRKVKSDPILIGLVGFALVVVFLILLWLVSGISKVGNVEQPSSLTQAEREKVLSQIQEWLAVDENKQRTSEVEA